MTLCLWISGKEIVWYFYVYFFCVCWSEMLCAHVYVPPIRADTRYKCMNPDVEFTVSKIVFYEILIMLRIKLKKKELFTRLWY